VKGAGGYIKEDTNAIVYDTAILVRKSVLYNSIYSYPVAK